MVKASVESEYVSGEWAVKNSVTQVIILEEPNYVDTDFGKRLRPKVQANDAANSVKFWTMNKTTEKTLIEILGDETRNWIGKIIPIVVSQTQTKGGVLSLTVYPNKLALQQIMAGATTTTQQTQFPQTPSQPSRQ